MGLASPATSLLAGRRKFPAVAGIGVLVVVPLVAWADLSGLTRASWSEVIRFLPVTVPAGAAFAAILVLERCIPADRLQPILSRGFWQDLMWTLFSAPVAFFGAFWLYRAVQWVFDNLLAGARFDLGDHLPFTVVVVICFVMGGRLDDEGGQCGVASAGWCGDQRVGAVPRSDDLRPGGR